MRGCITEFANPYDELRTLFVTVLMMASELFTLNISNVGSTVNRFTLNDFCTLISSWLMRSRKNACGATSARLNELGAVGDPRNDVGRITWPAGQGAGNWRGTRRTSRDCHVLRGGSARTGRALVALERPADLDAVRQRVGSRQLQLFAERRVVLLSSQNRTLFGLSGEVQFMSRCRSSASPPKICAPPPRPARNSRL